MHEASPPHNWRLSRAEWLLLAAVIVAWGSCAAIMGKDAGWDFLNYHWYDAYAFLHQRLGLDIAVAHQATYFNPLMHVPFYLLATLSTTWVALFYLGALQGLNVLPLYWMSRSALDPSSPRWCAFVLTLVCMLGSTAVSMIRKTSYDQSLLSVLVLSGLAVVMVGRATLRLPTRRAAALAALAGLLVGAAVALKPAEGPYSLGLAFALLVISGTARARLLRLAAAAVGGVAGMALSGGIWFVMLGHYSGNPLFPFFNDLLHSPLIGGGSFMDTRFIPHGWWAALSFPWQFALNYRVADDVPFRDLRIPLAYVLIPLSCLCWAIGRRSRSAIVRPEVAWIAFAFCVGSYLAWLRTLAIYRYLVALEMLAPLLIVAAIGLLPLSLRTRVAVSCLLLAISAAIGRYAPGPFIAGGDPYVQLTPLSIPHPDRTMLLMSGYEPMAYIIPSLPPSIPVLRIQGYTAGPGDGSGLSAQMRARVEAFSGDMYMMYAPDEHQDADRALADYHLRIDHGACQRLMTNLGGPYNFCLLHRS